MFARSFREDLAVPAEVPILLDPERQSYRLLELRRSIGSTFRLDTLKSARRAAGKGFRQSRTQGDPWQQGGVMVIDVDGTVLYGQRSEAAGDHPSVDEVLSALPPGDAAQ